MRALPYPGYSWSFTQHAIGLQAETLYSLLGCAARFEGESSDLGRKITEEIIANNLLTANKRDGVDDAWRDYQQILAELGLIYSTKLTQKLRLTDAGHMYLAGELGYSELIGIQALRYQYPNGQKSTMQSRQKLALGAAADALPSTVTELQSSRGVLIKPGLLVLRILLELYNIGGRADLSVDECLAFLLPCKKNSEWPSALAELITWRTGGSDLSHLNKHARRNVQDWFQLLGRTEMCEKIGKKIVLSAGAKSNSEVLHTILDEQENIKNYWIPTAFDNSTLLTWFDWFGHIGLSIQELATHPLDPEYLEKNFVGGIDEDDDAAQMDFSTSRELCLNELNINTLLQPKVFTPIDKIDQKMLDRINLGSFRRHSKTLLHDRIVASLAKKLGASGATLLDDRNSIDLMARWHDNSEAIFEIKTVTMRSLPGRLRMAIGQIEEYAYRRSVTKKIKPEKIIVINTELPESAWQVDFLVKTMDIGLLCTPGEDHFLGYPPAGSTTGKFWSK